MPRVSIKKKEYKVSDLAKYIASEMYAQDISQAEMATRLGVTQQAFSYKLKHSVFSYGDLLTICESLGTPDEVKVKLLTL